MGVYFKGNQMGNLMKKVISVIIAILLLANTILFNSIDAKAADTVNVALTYTFSTTTVDIGQEIKLTFKMTADKESGFSCKITCGEGLTLVSIVDMNSKSTIDLVNRKTSNSVFYNPDTHTLLWGSCEHVSEGAIVTFKANDTSATTYDATKCGIYVSNLMGMNIDLDSFSFSPSSISQNIKVYTTAETQKRLADEEKKRQEEEAKRKAAEQEAADQAAAKKCVDMIRGIDQSILTKKTITVSDKAALKSAEDQINNSWYLYKRLSTDRQKSLVKSYTDGKNYASILENSQTLLDAQKKKLAAAEQKAAEESRAAEESKRAEESKKAAESSIAESIEESIQESIEESIQESIEESIQESVEESVQESLKESIEESLKESARESEEASGEIQESGEKSSDEGGSMGEISTEHVRFVEFTPYKYSEITKTAVFWFATKESEIVTPPDYEEGDVEVSGKAIWARQNDLMEDDIYLVYGKKEEDDEPDYWYYNFKDDSCFLYRSVHVGEIETIEAGTEKDPTAQEGFFERVGKWFDNGKTEGKDTTAMLLMILVAFLIGVLLMSIIYFIASKKYRMAYYEKVAREKSDPSMEMEEKISRYRAQREQIPEAGESFKDDIVIEEPDFDFDMSEGGFDDDIEELSLDDDEELSDELLNDDEEELSDELLNDEEELSGEPLNEYEADEDESDEETPVKDISAKLFADDPEELAGLQIHDTEE